MPTIFRVNCFAVILKIFASSFSLSHTQIHTRTRHANSVYSFASVYTLRKVLIYSTSPFKLLFLMFKLFGDILPFIQIIFNTYFFLWIFNIDGQNFVVLQW